MYLLCTQAMPLSCLPVHLVLRANDALGVPHAFLVNADARKATLSTKDTVDRLEVNLKTVI